MKDSILKILAFAGLAVIFGFLATILLDHKEVRKSERTKYAKR